MPTTAAPLRFFVSQLTPPTGPVGGVVQPLDNLDVDPGDPEPILIIRFPVGVSLEDLAEEVERGAIIPIGCKPREAAALLRAGRSGSQPSPAGASRRLVLVK
jgi:hypothetical protein